MREKVLKEIERLKLEHKKTFLQRQKIIKRVVSLIVEAGYNKEKALRFLADFCADTMIDLLWNFTFITDLYFNANFLAGKFHLGRVRAKRLAADLKLIVRKNRKLLEIGISIKAVKRLLK
jgi:hypothetical protein